MPHKKNPDLLELIRGYTGHVYGNLMSILTTMKGLPLTYNRDMQLDKEPLFSSIKIIKAELKLMGKFTKGIELNKAAVKEALEDKEIYATKQAEDLVRNKKIPFKEAHDIVGRSIRAQELRDRTEKQL
jgi:argininosuccinate lyase